jgi:hypothetical protein
MWVLETLFELARYATLEWLLPHAPGDDESNHKPIPPSPHHPKRRMNLVTNQQTQQKLDQKTYKLTINLDTITGTFSEGTQPIIQFTVVNDHINKRSTMSLKQVHHPHGEHTPQGIRYGLEMTKEALPQVEALIKYPVMK